ncbi:MAG: hypothetical protein F6K44_22075 [Moorea sp. SIO3E2]|nr:hypothetical protein [Moorena sp. SIO3E2]
MRLAIGHTTLTHTIPIVPCSRFPIPDSRFPISFSLQPNNLHLSTWSLGIPI